MNLTEENFQCKRQEKELSKRSDAEVQIRMRRTSKGCGLLQNQPKIEKDGYGYHSCLCHENFQHPQLGQFIELHKNYEKGNLPFTGGFLDQPAQIMDIINLMDRLKIENEIAIQEKQAKKAKK